MSIHITMYVRTTEWGNKRNLCCVLGIVVLGLNATLPIWLCIFCFSFYICILLGSVKAFKHIISIAVHNTKGLTLILTYDLQVWVNCPVCACVCLRVCARGVKNNCMFELRELGISPSCLFSKANNKKLTEADFDKMQNSHAEYFGQEEK